VLLTEAVIQRNGQWIILCIILSLGLATAFYLYNLDKYSLVYFGDSASHMVISRKIVDWPDPGLKQLGTVWLPLPHLLLMPFSLVDPMFTSGFAGVVIGLPSLAITSVLLFKIVRTNLVSGISIVAFVSALLYASNPNILYMSLTAMTESPFMLFFVASAYYFQKWQRNLDQPKELLYCSICISLATACRYEGWVLPVFLIGFVVFLVLKKKIAKGIRSHMVILSIISTSGVGFWIFYNAYQYANPLEFANVEYYSAASQAFNRQPHESLLLPSINVLTVYGVSALYMYGPILLAAAILGCVLNKPWQARSELNVLYVFLGLPPFFTLFTLVIGIGEMTYWFNSRFLILISPLVVLLAALLLKNVKMRARKSRGILAAVIGVLFLFEILNPVFGDVITYLDAKQGFFYKVNPYSVKTGEVLGLIYDGASSIMMLTGSMQEHRIMQSSGIHLIHFDEIIEGSVSKRSFQQPWLYDKWLVVSKDPDPDGVKPTKYLVEERNNDLNKYYKRIYNNKYYEIFVTR
jgi:Dolichyl-phosphate-mannose-protein mannosyltransferase